MKLATDRLGAALLATFTLSSAALAQTLGSPPPMVPLGPGANRSLPFPQGRNGGGFGARMVFGVVRTTDAAASTLMIASSMGGEAVTVKVGSNTQIVRETI